MSALEQWIKDNRPTPPKGYAFEHSRVGNDYRSIDYYFRHRANMRALDVVKIVSVKTPEPVVTMPIPSWIDGYDFDTDVAFLSEAITTIKESAQQWIAVLALESEDTAS